MMVIGIARSVESNLIDRSYGRIKPLRVTRCEWLDLAVKQNGVRPTDSHAKHRISDVFPWLFLFPFSLRRFESMAKKLRGHKTETVAVRLTERQFGKLEKVAMLRDATISDVMRELVEGITVDVGMPYQVNSNASGLVLADGTGIAL